MSTEKQVSTQENPKELFSLPANFDPTNFSTQQKTFNPKDIFNPTKKFQPKIFFNSKIILNLKTYLIKIIF